MVTPTLEALLASLEKKADAACPGPWDNRSPNTLDNSAKPRFIWCEYGFIAECIGISLVDTNTKNAEFIAAANPATVKKLIAALRVADEKLGVAINYLHWRTDDLCGDDLVGDGRLTQNFNARVRELEEARSRIREILNVKND